MTVRELIQSLLLEGRNLDAKVYIQKSSGDEEFDDMVIEKVTNGGTNDAVFIEVRDWEPKGPSMNELDDFVIGPQCNEFLPDYDYFSGCSDYLGYVDELS